MRRQPKKAKRTYEEYIQEVHDHWVAMLEIYVRKHGHAYVGGVGKRSGDKKHSDSGLRDWCYKQRTRFADGVLPKSDINQLKRLGFDFTPPPRMYEWMQQYERLRARYQSTGKRLHPTKIRDKAIADWADAQRKFRRSGRLQPIKIQLLDKIKFEWDPLIERWLENFEGYRTGMKNAPTMLVETHLPPTLQRWAELQRRRLERGFMTDDQKGALEGVGFLWSRRRTAWMQKYQLYKEFTTSPPSARSKSYARMSDAVNRWSAIQRQALQLGRLDSEQQELLNTVGFVFKPLDKTFERSLRRLDAHIRMHGPLPQDLSQDVVLQKWVALQRVRYRKGTLQPERIKALNARNFDWEPLPSAQASSNAAWAKHIQVCERYFKQHGVLPQVIRKDGTGSVHEAAIYLMGLRMRMKQQGGPDPVVLTPARIKTLNRMKMRWEDKHATVWDARVSELEAFVRKFGHAAVTRSMPGYEELGHWAEHLRSRKHQISKKRMKQLRAAGFVWDVLEDRWDERYEEVRASIKHHGRYISSAVSTSTATWVVKQRTRNTRGELEVERAQKLRAIGLLDSPHDIQFKQFIIELTAYKRIHKNTRVPHLHPDHRELSHKVARARQRYNKGTLKKEHIEALEKLGFEWRLRASRKT